MSKSSHATHRHHNSPVATLTGRPYRENMDKDELGGSSTEHPPASVDELRASFERVASFTIGAEEEFPRRPGLIRPHAGRTTRPRWARRGGATPDESHEWWDLRLRPRYGTIEVRAGERIAENAWLATRDGLRGSLIDLQTGARVATSERLHELVQTLLPAAATLGCDRELLGIGRIVLEGGGADLQRHAFDTGPIPVMQGLSDRSQPARPQDESAYSCAEPPPGTLSLWR